MLDKNTKFKAAKNSFIQLTTIFQSSQNLILIQKRIINIPLILPETAPKATYAFMQMSKFDIKKLEEVVR